MEKITFSRYPKVHRVGKEEVDDIFTTYPDVTIYIEEKIDGANFRFAKLTDRGIVFGSRNLELTPSKDGTYQDRFDRCVQWIKDNVNFDVIPDNHMVAGECMVKHTITYNWDDHPPFIGFDLINLENMQMVDYDTKKSIFEEAGIPLVCLVDSKLASEISELSEDMIPKSYYGNTQAEGIVFKNYDLNKTAKLVSSRFREKNKDTFGGSPKRAKDDTERVVLSYCSNARIEKCVFKLMEEQGYKLNLSMMGELVNVVYLDIWEEEWREIVKTQYTINFKNMRKKVGKRCKHVLDQMMIDNQNEKLK